MNRQAVADSVPPRLSAARSGRRSDVARGWVGALLTATAAAVAGERSLETSFLRFRWAEETGAYAIDDRAGRVTWLSNLTRARFGEASVRVNGRTERRELAACDIAGSGNGLTATFRGPDGGGRLRVTVRTGEDGRSLDFAWEAEPGLAVESIRLLDSALWTTGADAGAVFVPVREGLFIPADSGLAFTHSFDTYAYEGCHMAMFGVSKAGATALVTWSDPYARVDLTSTLSATDAGPYGQVLAPSLVMREGARTCRVTFPGLGDYVTVAAAYREVAQKRGWRVTWQEKLRGHPERAALFGATNFKLWTLLARQMNEESTREEWARVNWTFDEAAQVAEHLKRDLRLERLLFGMGGWIHRGYDNRHPDILPTAPECGGDAAFTDCARRIRQLGYTLSLHDNYQDIYRDSPSWNEDLVMKSREGELIRGGKWLGGRAYLTCSQQAVGLAQRPQNLPAVHRLAGDGAYFIDTTFAAGLQECFDPKHPLTRGDDLHWKQTLCDYARTVFGSFGSECGREWAIPHADFFEGLTGVSGGAFHDAGLLAKVGGAVVPMFEVVFRDCIALYGKYGYDPAEAAPYVLQHLVIGRPLNHHNVPPHLYWQSSPAETDRVQVTPLQPELDQIARRVALISWPWEVLRPPAEDWRVFAHFTDAEGKIRFQADHAPRTATSQWQPGRIDSALTPVEVPSGLEGVFDVRVGMFRQGEGRARLTGDDDGDQRYTVGRLEVIGDRIRLLPPDASGPARSDGPGAFVRADHGWARQLHPYDRFVKNTSEVLSPLHELTAQMLLTEHRFLNANRTVQRSVFGSGRDAVTVIVNFGKAAYSAPAQFGGEVVLPQYGFLVESPTFVALHALTWNGATYPRPVLYTLRARDEQTLDRSRSVRIYHGFGEGGLRFRNQTVVTDGEVTLTLQP